MLAPLLMIFTALQSQVDGPVPVVDRGSTLFHNCQAAVRLYDSTDGGASSDSAPAAHCADYMNGFIEGAISAHGICTGNTSEGTIIRIYVKFMEDNPSYLDRSRIVGVYRALWNNYRCPPK